MASTAYKLGSDQALHSLGIIKVSGDTLDRVPFPNRDSNITAERLAKVLQQDETPRVEISPDNQKFDRWSRPVVWSASNRISDELPNPGLYTPHSTRA